MLARRLMERREFQQIAEVYPADWFAFDQQNRTTFEFPQFVPPNPAGSNDARC